jgi:hypothetical protein
MEDENNPMFIYEILITDEDGIIILMRERVGENIHNVCWWMQENADRIQKIFDKYSDMRPIIKIEDISNPLGWDH